MSQELANIVSNYKQRQHSLKLVKHDIELLKATKHSSDLPHYIIMYNQLVTGINIELNTFRLLQRAGISLPTEVPTDLRYLPVLNGQAELAGVCYVSAEDVDEIKDRLNSVLLRPLTIKLK